MLVTRRFRKRAKGFSHGGPRRGWAYHVEAVKAAAPALWEAQMTYSLDAIAVVLGVKRRRMYERLHFSGLPYYVVSGGRGGRSVRVPYSTLKALEERLISLRRGRPRWRS